MCQKIGYETREDAIQDSKIIYTTNKHVSRKFQSVAGRNLKKLRPYLCVRCNKWHLTRQKSTKKSRKTAMSQARQAE